MAVRHPVAHDVLLFAYDRRRLRRLEFMCLIRQPGGQVQCRFINENARDSGSHGAVEVRPMPELREWDMLCHFSCLGAEAWNASRSWTHVRGTHSHLEGVDSFGRTVRMACLAYVRYYNPVHFVDIVHLIQICGGFSGLRLFRSRLAAIGRLPQLPVFPADVDVVERYHDGEYEFLWILVI